MLIRMTHGNFPEEYLQRTFDSWVEDVGVTYEDGKTDTFRIGFWDMPIDSEYEQLRPLSYPDCTIFTLAFAIDDFSSLKEIIDLTVWEVTNYVPDATIVLVGMKADKREECKWKSILGVLDEEPISQLEAHQFAKSIGALTYWETSAKMDVGCKNFTKYFVMWRYSDLLHRSETTANLATSTDSKKKCQLQ